MFFFFELSNLHRDLHSFPTRRSSDLSSAGMVDAGFENQKELTKMQLDNQKEIVQLHFSKLFLILKSGDRKSGSAGMPRPNSYAVLYLKKKITNLTTYSTLITSLFLNR